MTNLCAGKLKALPSMSSILIAFMLALITAISATGCAPIPPNLEEKWTYSMLRGLDTIDSPIPECDLLAIYSRVYTRSIQLRIDLLNIDLSRPADLTLYFDYIPGGMEIFSVPKFLSDLKLVVSSRGTASFYTNSGKLLVSPGLRVYKNAFLDAIFISFSMDILNQQANTFTVMASVSSSHYTDELLDILGPVESDALPPPAIPIVLAFWNTFQFSTPAQALRSWDGAHTGPDSGRNGLRYLLEAAQKYNTPIAISGLSSREAYSALDYLGIGGFYKSLISNDVVYSLVNVNNGYAQYPLIDNYNGATESGLSSSVVAKIFELKQGAPSHTPIILGGSLAGSFWGSPDTVGPTLKYIVEHPWIEITRADHLVLNRPSDDNVDTINLDYIILQRHNSIAPNKLRELAWDMYSMLTLRDPSKNTILKNGYVGQVGHIYAAAEWANSPTPLADCSMDIDWDGEDECILASNSIFTTYERMGGYMAFAFSLADDGPHQIIGPSYQVAIGLSDPFNWNEQNGHLSDPTQILGTNSGADDLLEEYSAEFYQTTLVLESPTLATRIFFTVDDTSITMRVEGTSYSQPYRIPFILDPWARFQSGWSDHYKIEKLGDHWLLSIGDGFKITIYSSANLSISSFISSRPLMAYPEDPNADYTSGYFLPFPMILVDIDNEEKTTIILVPAD